MSSNVTKQDLVNILKAYVAWKGLNNELSEFASRTSNFPEAISESIASYYFGYQWHNKTKTKQKGDASTNDGQLVEIKASSNFDRDTTSFSPKIAFDILIFARLDKATDKLYLYNLHMNKDEFNQVSVNANDTVLSQGTAKRRPRLSIINQLIIPNNIQPDFIVDLKQLAKELGVNL